MKETCEWQFMNNIQIGSFLRKNNDNLLMSEYFIGQLDQLLII